MKSISTTPSASLSDRRIFLSTLPAEQSHRRLALAVVLISSALFLAAAPFAQRQLPAVPAFIPIIASTLVINDLITAVLLVGQFRFLHSPALLVLAGGYLFTACMTIAHALTFPGLFSSAGLLGAGPQSTAWLYIFWHAGFPLFAVAYALLKNREPFAIMPPRRATPAILGVAAAIVVAVGGLVLAATAWHAVLPAVMQGNRIADLGHTLLAVTWLLSAVALGALWLRPPHSVLDVWLMVVMCAWIFDIALSAVLNAGRFDLGFYAGRIYGLLAASFVLVVLLLESNALYSRAINEREDERRRTEDALARHAKRLKILTQIDQSMAAEMAPQAIAAAVIEPLRDLLGVPRAIVNRFDLAAGEVEWIAAAGRRRMHTGPGVRFSIRLMGDLEGLKRGEPQRIDVHALPPGPEVEALLASGVHAYMAVPMIAGGELIGAVSFGGEAETFPAEQVQIVQEVATQLAIAITQARLLERVRRQAVELELRVSERTSELKAANSELEAFSYSVSHDLRAPLRAIDGFSRIVQEDYADRLDAEGRRLLGVIRGNSQKMAQLIDDLLAYSRLGRRPVASAEVDMNRLCEDVLKELRESGARAPGVVLEALPAARGDATLLKQALANLLANAAKFSGKRERPLIHVSGVANGVECVYCVKDNGAGFDMRYSDKLFKVFQRLHREDEFDGTGVGLAIVQRVVSRHGGRVWAEGKVDDGAAFYFSLPGGGSDGAV